MSEPTQIEDGLWLGGGLNMVANLAGRRPVLFDLPPDGVDVVVSLRTEHQNVFAADSGVVANLHFPIDDHPDATPTPAWLRAVVACVRAWRQAGKTVLVHCAAGVSRSGMVVVAYLMAEHGWSYDRAMNEVCARRPQVCPNAGFARLLKEWEAAK